MSERPPVRGKIGPFPAPLMFVFSALSQYLGAALAVGLFAQLPPQAVAWWRVLIAAVVLLVIRRPWRRGFDRRELMVSAVYGFAMTTMNVLFYLAIAHAPLGAVVALEFLGPIMVAVIFGHSWRCLFAAGAGACGVLAIGGTAFAAPDNKVLIGFVYALAAGAAWAAYILFGRKAALARSGLDSLAMGCLVGTLILGPWAAPDAIVAFGSVQLFFLVLGVGVLSTAVPYSIEIIALKHLPTHIFALLTALLPATSMLVGLVVLRQVPTILEGVGLVLISIAVWLANRSE